MLHQMQPETAELKHTIEASSLSTQFQCYPELSGHLLCCTSDPSALQALLSWLQAKQSIRTLLLDTKMAASGMLLPSLVTDPTRPLYLSASTATHSCLRCLLSFTALRDVELASPAEELCRRHLNALTSLANLCC